MNKDEDDDAVLRQWQQRVIDAAGNGTALRIVGGGSKDWYGQSLQGEVFDTRAHAGVVAYEPSELVVTVRCGTPLAELEAVLAQQGQMLPFEPPHFAAHGTATVGGMVASGLAGPARASHGCVRDYLLGLQLLDGRGQILNFGGQVMKNVAGYDVSRLMAGALGTLGIILQVSLKVLPRPLAGTTLCFEVDEPRALQMMNHWATQALPLSATSWVAGVLCVRLAGAGAAVRAAQARMGGQVLAQEQAQAHWQALREQTHEFFAGAKQLWRLSVPSMTPMLIMPGPLMLEWGGAQRWLRLDAPPDAVQASGQAERIRQVVAASGGHATLFRDSTAPRRGDSRVALLAQPEPALSDNPIAANPLSTFHPLPPALAQIHANLKAAFDPAGIFNPARMYADSTIARS